LNADLELLPSGLEDLLNSFHILLCIIDLIAEELQQTKSEVLNAEFGNENNIKIYQRFFQWN
jgi:hypothetical protein